MNNSNVVVIDSAKLEALLATYCNARGILLKDLSLETGYSRRYFADVLKRGAIRKPGIVFLENQCGIKLEQYVKTDDVKETVSPETTITGPTDINEKLDRIIALLENISNDRFPDMSSLYGVKDEISKVGNIQMQQLEYLKEIKDKQGYKPYAK